MALGDRSYLLVIVVDGGIGQLALEIGDLGSARPKSRSSRSMRLRRSLVASWRRLRSSAAVTRANDALGSSARTPTTRELGWSGGRSTFLVDAGEQAGPAFAHRDEAVGDLPDQVAIVGDEQHGAGVGAQGVLEHVAARQVEVVGGLVEHQQVDRVRP